VLLAVERLETRYCPAPVITSLTATVEPGGGRSVTLTGSVTDDNPQTVVIDISGVMSGSTNPDANGNFSYTANASALGTVSAVATDSQQLQSNTAQAQVAAAKPSLTLHYTIATQKYIVLVGTVTAGTAGGLNVTFTGVVSGGTVTKADGTFNTTQIACCLGQIQATVTDVWGQVSDPASVTVTQGAPVIDGFRANRNAGTTWTFSGTVTDLTPAGNTVTFSGLPSLQGKTATTKDDGTFSLVVTLQQGESGTAAAIRTDWFDLTSPEKLTVVSY
jgi:hypothetical protein